MRAIDLDELPSVSPWPAALLGIAPCEPRVKSKAEVSREFENDKWGALLSAIQRSGARWTVRDADRFFLSGEQTAASVGDALYTGPSVEAHQRFVDEIAQRVAGFLPASALVELGAGYGSVFVSLARRLQRTASRLIAADYTDSGVACLAHIAETEGLDVSLGRCDFAEPGICSIAIPAGAVICTCMAAVYVPTLSRSFVESFMAFAPKSVLHFEPCVEHYDDTLLGQLRRKYIHVNDYNRNLVTLLREFAAEGSIEILREERCFFGENCLLPCSFVAWKPVNRRA